MGSVPVLNARVSVGVEIETNNGTFLGMSPRPMEDDGNGDDDMISGNRFVISRSRQDGRCQMSNISSITNLYWLPQFTHFNDPKIFLI